MANRYIIINASGGAGGGSAETFTQSFNASSDWGAASGGVYSIDIAQSTHGKSVQPIVQVYEQNGLDFEQVIIETVIDDSGDITIKVTENNDTRFAGKVVII